MRAIPVATPAAAELRGRYGGGEETPRRHPRTPRDYDVLPRLNHERIFAMRLLMEQHYARFSASQIVSIREALSRAEKPSPT